MALELYISARDRYALKAGRSLALALVSLPSIYAISYQVPIHSHCCLGHPTGFSLASPMVWRCVALPALGIPEGT